MSSFEGPEQTQYKTIPYKICAHVGDKRQNGNVPDIFHLEPGKLNLIALRLMEKAKEFLKLSEEESASVSQLKIHPHRPGLDCSFYEDFALRGIRVDRVEPGIVSCTFKVPSRLTVR